MLASTYTAALVGVSAELVRVEADVSYGLPSFTIVGQDPPPAIRALSRNGLRVCPGVADLTAFYDHARLFVAPTRYAAGIPLKVVHAAAAGLPVVATSVLARQLGWESPRDLVTGDSADEFATACVALLTGGDRWHAVRAAALVRVADDFSHGRFRQSVADALG